MKAIGTAELQDMLTMRSRGIDKHIGETFLVLNRTEQIIVAKIKILEPPKIYKELSTYKLYKREVNKK
jgi:hypothetical protein